MTARQSFICNLSFPLKRMLPLIALLLVNVTANASQSAAQSSDHSSALSQSRQYSTRLQAERQALSEITASHGPFSPRLLPPLRALSRTLAEAGDLEETLALLEQQLQIQRVNGGLYNSEQVAIIREMLSIHAEQQQWDRVAEQLGHLTWLYTRDTQSPPPDILSGLQELRDWRLFLLGRDNRNREALHFLDIHSAAEHALGVARQHYGEGSPELANFIHDLALSDLHIGLAIMLNNNTRAELITQVSGPRRQSLSYGMDLTTPADFDVFYGPQSGDVINRAFRFRMHRSFGHIDRLRKHYASAGDLQGEAMANIALGDIRLLGDQHEIPKLRYAGPKRGSSNIGSASNYYRKAIALLQQAGISESAIEAHFSCPVILPVSRFEAVFTANTADCRSGGSTASVDFGDVRLLMDGIADSRPDRLGLNRDGDDSRHATLEFAVQTNGQPSRIEVVSSQPDSTGTRAYARNLTEKIQFRPAFEEGRPVRRDRVRMRLILPPN